MRKTCYGCYFEVDRECYWFSIYNEEHPKHIPNDVFKEGCKQYKNTEMSGLEQHRQFIQMIDGEILSNKYNPPIKQKRTYKKKYVKSPHNYSHRKDAQ